ncbi:MAG: hypothetical protein MJ241_06305 [Bacilli bacterium]|nr:hypothetical protein [Bacilli bacterium]
MINAKKRLIIGVNVLCSIYGLVSCFRPEDHKEPPIYTTKIGETFTFHDGCSVTTTHDKGANLFTIVFENSPLLNGHPFYFDIRLTVLNDKNNFEKLTHDSLSFYKDGVLFEFDDEHLEIGDAVYNVSYNTLDNMVIDMIDNDCFVLFVADDLVVFPN